jgi:hypothetical protein
MYQSPQPPPLIRSHPAGKEQPTQVTVERSTRHRRTTELGGDVRKAERGGGRTIGWASAPRLVDTFDAVWVVLIAREDPGPNRYVHTPSV